MLAKGVQYFAYKCSKEEDRTEIESYPHIAQKNERKKRYCIEISMHATCVRASEKWGGGVEEKGE